MVKSGRFHKASSKLTIAPVLNSSREDQKMQRYLKQIDFLINEIELKGVDSMFKSHRPYDAANPKLTIVPILGSPQAKQKMQKVLDQIDSLIIEVESAKLDITDYVDILIDFDYSGFSLKEQNSVGSFLTHHLDPYYGEGNYIDGLRAARAAWLGLMVAYLR